MHYALCVMLSTSYLRHNHGLNVYVCMYVCMYVFMYICMCLCIFTFLLQWFNGIDTIIKKPMTKFSYMLPDSVETCICKRF